jgi:cytochrome c peroxidase
MKSIKFITLAMACMTLTASVVFAEDEVMKRAQGMFKPIPETVPAMKGKSFTPAKVELGKMLYFDPRLSASALISCNTCHNVGMGGADFQETSVGHRWQKGPRNAPTVLNSVFNIAQFWGPKISNSRQKARSRHPSR